jgi:phage tail-like protein
MSAVPSYRRFFYLHGPDAKSWRVRHTHNLTQDASGAYALAPQPGVAFIWPPIPGTAPVAPIALASDAQGSIHVLDGADMRVKVIDPAGKRPARALASVGGFGADARAFKAAQDVAIWEHGALVVADAGDRSVKIFSTYPHALLAVWTQFGKPTRLACGAGNLLWVLDAEGARVLAVDRDGAIRAALSGLSRPIALTATDDGGVFVLDDMKVLFFANADSAPAVVGSAPGGRCLTIADDGTLYVGSDVGLVYAFSPDGSGRWRAPGVGVVGQGAKVNALLRLCGGALLALAQPPGAKAAGFWQLDAAAARERCGSLITLDLDSGVADNIWHRIKIDAEIPGGAAIDVNVACFNEVGGRAVKDLRPPPIRLSGDVRDCLVQSGDTDKGASGRYLRLHLILRGDGVATPILSGIRVWISRDSWVKYLPAIYQEDDESRSFLSRFLAIAQTSFEDFDETIDDIWKLFDPASAPANWFAWLAAWLALPVEPSWSDAQKRAVLKNAGEQYRLRGTIKGLEQLILDYADVKARLFEHFRLRQLIFLRDDPEKAMRTGGGRLWSRDYYRRLQLGAYANVGYFSLVDAPEPAVEAVAWGAHEFTVFFDTEPLITETMLKKVAAVVEREKPAHTMAHYRPVYSRFRVGVQATLGMDTRVGAIGEAVLGRVSTLNYDAVLAATTPERDIRAQGSSVRPRLGVSSRLC